MASVFTGPRFSQARRLAALVAAFVLVAGLLGALAPGALGAGAEPAQTIGANSCIGQDACTGATGNIGANSCNGDHACFQVIGYIAPNSCVGAQACSEADGRIRHDSCNGDHACYSAQSINIAANSCNGFYACRFASGDIGHNSCNGGSACVYDARGVGDNSCNEDHACSGLASSVGDDSCNADGACVDAVENIGRNSCNGDYACWWTGGAIGVDSCNGRRACYNMAGDVGDCAGNLPDQVPAECFVPDGRIRKGSGAYVGNDIYNTTGADQAKVISAAPGSTITFGISVQNDSAVVADSFTVVAAGSASDLYRVTYFKGTTNITAAVVAGTYTTPSLAPGAKYLITARVKAMANAPAGSSVTRLVTITSLGDGTRQDALMFTVLRGVRR